MNTIAVSDSELMRVFFSIVLLLLSAHSFGYFFQRFLGIPKVIGEIVGGLILGPTILGFFLPDAYQWLFHAFESEGQLIATLSSVGLMFLMFLSGFEIQKSIQKNDKKLMIAILIGSTAFSFLVGWFMPSFYDFSPYLGTEGNMLSFTLVLSIAIAVTSIPVISKIFMDLGISDTRFAKIVLATATIEDVVLWLALALATSLANGETLTAATVASKALLTLAFFAVALLLIPKIFEWTNTLRMNLVLKSSATGYVLIVCFLFTAIAGMLNVNSIFGAFLAGIVIGMSSDENITRTKHSIKEIGLGFFIPIYFAVVGLKLDLVHHFDFSFFLFFLLFAVIVKTFATVLSARVAGQDWFSSLNLGVTMNARGGPGIVLATVAYDLGIINETFFAILILIAIVTSLIAGYWLKFVLSKGWNLLGSSF